MYIYNVCRCVYIYMYMYVHVQYNWGIAKYHVYEIECRVHILCTWHAVSGKRVSGVPAPLVTYLQYIYRVYVYIHVHVGRKLFSLSHIAVHNMPLTATVTAHCKVRKTGNVV